MIVLDAGPLYAALDINDAHHKTAVTFFVNAVPPLIVPSPVLGEVCYWLGARIGPAAEAKFLATICQGAMQVAHPECDDFARAATIIEQYADNNIGFVDAIVVATAERFGATKVATVDYRHFGVIRPKHVPAFELLP